MFTGLAVGDFTASNGKKTHLRAALMLFLPDVPLHLSHTPQQTPIGAALCEILETKVQLLFARVKAFIVGQ